MAEEPTQQSAPNQRPKLPQKPELPGGSRWRKPIVVWILLAVFIFFII